MVGFFLLFGLTIWHFGRYRKLHHEALEGKRGLIEPEERLIPCMSARSVCRCLMIYVADEVSSDDCECTLPSWFILVLSPIYWSS
jgi:hypothetical protein